MWTDHLEKENTIKRVPDWLQFPYRVQVATAMGAFYPREEICHRFRKEVQGLGSEHTF